MEWGSRQRHTVSSCVCFPVQCFYDSLHLLVSWTETVFWDGSSEISCLVDMTTVYHIKCQLICWPTKNYQQLIHLSHFSSKNTKKKREDFLIFLVWYDSKIYFCKTSCLNLSLSRLKMTNWENNLETNQLRKYAAHMLYITHFESNIK